MKIYDIDGINYGIFTKSQKLGYNIYRPATYLDSRITGLRFIGPQQ